MLSLPRLTSLCLDGCPLSTVQVARLLTGLPRLARLDCCYGRQSRVVAALSALPPSARLSLTSLVWTRPPRPASLPALTTLLPHLKHAKVTWNVHEVCVLTSCLANDCVSLFGCQCSDF